MTLSCDCAIERTIEQALDTPLARLIAFAGLWESGDLIDPYSGLTAEDLRSIVRSMNLPGTPAT